MPTYNILCSGNGPHTPASGVIATSDTPPIPGRDYGRCPSCPKAADVTVTNRSTLDASLIAALAANITYIGIASPTTAQNTAQIKALSRQVDALIRILESQLDVTTGT